MERELIVTADGSHSVRVAPLNITYHSVHGAIRESGHVYIKALAPFLESQQEVRVFEMGFGTGLNALLTYIAAEQKNVFIDYITVEKYPLDITIANRLNYCALLKRPDLQGLLSQLHAQAWEQACLLSSNFRFTKIAGDIQDIALHMPSIDVVYYDAFAPDVQPGLWQPDVFKKLAGWMEPGGVLVTYCSKGVVRRAMQEAGLSVGKLPGPPGKREITRAVKE